MNDHAPSRNDSNPSHSSPPRSIWLAVIGAVALLAIFGNVYQWSQTTALRREMTALHKDSADLRAKLVDSDTAVQNALGSLRQDLATIKQDSDASLAKAQEAATRHADLLAQKQKVLAKQLSAELGRVKETTDQATAKLNGISTDVGSVKTEVGSVRSDVDTAKTNIDAANSELQRIRGDMGVMSGLVATNGKEIQILRDLGDRNIYQFTLTKSAGSQRVGDIQVALRKTDVKRNRYTVDVMADDRTVEKKDRGTNEPVQFYTAGARQPYELVVNTVKKDQVTGYLATPKVKVSRMTPPAGSPGQ
jgi:predicted  nucleic acid-binding Zn-ribbon protein